MHNVWFGNVTKQMNRTLQGVLGDQLSELPSNYHISNDIFTSLCTIEKESAQTASCTEGHGDEFYYYMT